MLEIIECEQNTEQWHLARSKIPTASSFHTILASGRGGGPSVTRKKYMYKLAAEAISGVPVKSYSNADMDRGHMLEPEALATYEFINDVKCQLVGFIKNGNKGCSPDALVGNDGMVQIKTKQGDLQLELILDKQEMPSGHKAQVQGEIWVAEREWSDFFCYSPGLPYFQSREYRDDKYINGTLWPAVDKFNTELLELIERIRNV